MTSKDMKNKVLEILEKNIKEYDSYSRRAHDPSDKQAAREGRAALEHVRFYIRKLEE